MLIRRARNKKGTTAVEFAFVLPLFLLLIFGIIDFGWYFCVEQTLQYATREGMRLALVGGQLTDPQGNPISRVSSIIQTIQNYASVVVDPSKLSIYIYPITSNYQDPSNWQTFVGAGANAGGPGTYMRVKTTYNYQFMTPFIAVFFPGSQTTIVAQGTYENEQF